MRLFFYPFATLFIFAKTILMKRILTTLCFFMPLLLFAQETQALKSVDSLYREDQFYFGFTYNLITSAPNNVSNRGFSGGLQFGFIRDMPINKKRNLAFALGFGLSFNRYGNTLGISNSNNSNESTFSVLLNETNFDSNRFSTSAINIPIEFRWRSSSPSEYKFWRVYTGVTFSYNFWNKVTFAQNGDRFIYKNIPEFNKFQSGITLLFGYNTINIYAYYSITSFFNENAIINNEEVKFKPLKLGIKFYFL